VGLIILLYKSVHEEVNNDSPSHCTDHLPCNGRKIVNRERLKGVQRCPEYSQLRCSLTKYISLSRWYPNYSKSNSGPHPLIIVGK
jgi:hypothetical protein